MNTNSSHEDILLNSIWIEMKQANTNKYYSELLIDQHLRRSKWFTIFSTGFSIGGAALSFINDIFPIAACTALGVAEILKLIFPYYIMKPDELSKLSSLSITYDSYFIKLKKYLILSIVMKQPPAKPNYNIVLYTQNIAKVEKR